VDISGLNTSTRSIASTRNAIIATIAGVGERRGLRWFEEWAIEESVSQHARIGK
jgi:hypothetical protein